MSPYNAIVIPEIDYEVCQACRRCEAARNCRFKALRRLDRDEPPYVAVELCQGCGDCARFCPHGAVRCPKLDPA